VPICRLDRERDLLERRQGLLELLRPSISPSTFELDDKRSYYKVVIRFSPNRADGTAVAWILQPGMAVEADIISGSRSLLQYMLKPIYRGIDVAFSER
jgi:membrane fusion protein, adhesin transport system